MKDVEEVQRMLCEKYGTPFNPPQAHSSLGIPKNVLGGEELNGLRGKPLYAENGAQVFCGWTFWLGDERPDTFTAIYVEDLAEYFPQAIPFLGLPPGWLFSVVGENIAVCHDPEIFV